MSCLVIAHLFATNLTVLPKKLVHCRKPRNHIGCRIFDSMKLANVSAHPVKSSLLTLYASEETLHLYDPQFRYGAGLSSSRMDINREEQCESLNVHEEQILYVSQHTPVSNGFDVELTFPSHFMKTIFVVMSQTCWESCPGLSEFSFQL